MKIEACPLPEGALLLRHREMAGTYTDCFTVSVGRAVSSAEYIEAFYTTWLFKCERFVLFLIGRGCTDEDASRLARGAADRFAAWTVEGRAEGQLLVCDFAKATRSWLMVGPRPDGRAGTRLYFGSAVVAHAKDRAGNPQTSWVVRVLQPAHRFYARSLLRAAARKLDRR